MEDDTEVLDLESRSIADLQQTRADRLRQSVTAPDFSPTTIQTTKDVLSESVMELSDAERSDILRSAGVYSSTSKQVSTAIENALIGMNQLGDETTIAFGNIANYITGGALGQELQDIAYESMAHRYAAMADNEDAIGGIRSELAQLAGGATSFLQLALEGIATAGVLPNVHMGVQAFGEGAYNDMKAYADSHDGSLEGYKPKGIDLAVNTANALLQVYIEEKFGVGSPRFFVGASRGFIQEGLSGALQESTQGILSDLAEVVKDNQEIGTILENADQYIRDAVIGGLLQGAMGAATYHQNYAKATNNVANAIAKVRGHETPTAEDQQQAEKIIDAKERGYASALTTEFKAVFDASTGEGKLQQNIAAALKKAVEAQELDLGVADETEMAQKLEQIATQETLNALEMAQEQGRSVAEMELNNIVYKDGAIWLEGVTPQVGERAADYARVLAERQSGLAQAQMKLDALSREVQQTKKDLAEARAQSKQALVDKLQARLEKQNALAEKRRIQTEQLKAQTEKIQARLAKELEQKEVKAEPKPKMEPRAKQEQQKSAPKVEMPESQVEPVNEPVTEEPAKQPAEPKPLAKVAERAKKYKGEKKSVKAEREAKKKAKSKKTLMTLKELKEKLTEHFKQVYQGASDWLIQKYVDEAIEDVELTRNKNTMLQLLAENFDEYYKDGKVDTEEILYDGDIKGETVFAQYMMETGDIAANEDSDSDAMEVVDTFLNAVHDLPITTKEQAMEWVKNHQYESTVKKLGLDENAVDNDIFEFEGSEYDLSGVDISSYQREKAEAELKRQEDSRRNKITGRPLTREQAIENMTNGSDRFLKIVIPVKGKSFIEANKESLDKIKKDMYAQADFLQRALANDKITPDMIGEIFDFVESMPQGTYLSNVYYDIMVKPTTPTDVALKAKDKYNRAMTESTTQEDWTGKTPSEVATEKIKTVFGAYQAEIKNYEKQGVITDTDVEGQSDDLSQLGQELINQELLDYIFMKYNIDPRVQAWIRENPNLLQNNNDQRDAWEGTSGADLVDILGTEQDYAPEGFVREDDEGVVDDNYDYELVVYKMPQTQEEFENKVVSAMYKQTAEALDIDEKELEDATLNDDRTPFLFQSKTEGAGSDKARGGYDERLKRIVLGEKSDLTTIQHEFAHYWIQNNFKWARSGLASEDWLRRWRDVEEALGIEPQDRLLSRQASEKFARAYERYIMEGKASEDLKWAFDGFQKFYQDTYEDLENEYFDLSEELDPAIVDWFNRQRPATEQSLKDQAYKNVAKVAMEQGAEIITDAGDGNFVVSSMDNNGNVVSDVVVSDQQTQDSKLAHFSDKKKNRRVVEGLRESNPDIQSDKYNVLNRAETVEEAHNWIVRDREGAWAALNDPNTNPIDRTALFQAFKNEAENGDYELGAELASIKFPKEMTELGQAISVLGERPEFDPLTILEEKQKSLGEPTSEEMSAQTDEMGLDADLDANQVKELEETTECVL